MVAESERSGKGPSARRQGGDVGRTASLAAAYQPEPFRSVSLASSISRLSAALPLPDSVSWTADQNSEDTSLYLTLVGADGRVDRKKLGPIVFADGAKLDRLNAIVHPLIRAEIERRITRAREKGAVRAVVVEAAILLEAGWRSLVDQVWVISARREDVVERLAAQRGMAASETDARMAKQMTDAERRAVADVVIENAGSLDDLRTRLTGLWQTVVPR